MSRLLSKGAYNPDVAGGLIETLSEYIVADPGLTPRKMLEFAGVLSGVDPTGITTYQINSNPRTIQGNAVLVPSIGGDNMQAVLAVFRGEATLGEAPVQILDTVPDVDDPTVAEQPPTTDQAVDPDTTAAEPVPATTLPSVQADENQFGVVPDKNVSC